MLRTRTPRSSAIKRTCSGLGLGSTIRSTAVAAVWSDGSSNEVASCVRRLRTRISAALVTIRVTQVERPDRPSKRGRFLKAESIPSWGRPLHPPDFAQSPELGGRGRANGEPKAHPSRLLDILRPGAGRYRFAGDLLIPQLPPTKMNVCEPRHRIKNWGLR